MMSLLRPLSRRPRLSMSLALMPLVYGLLHATGWLPATITRLLVAWNTGVWVYLALAGRMMWHETPAEIRQRASTQDEGALAILLLVVVSALVSLGGIVVQLSLAREAQGLWDRLWHVALVVMTITCSWFFTQVMFAQHYAHDFYGDQDRGGDGGLQFPGAVAPDFSDFLYLSCGIGVACQTADVTLCSRKMRRVGLVHGVLSFVFNTTLVALLINVASSMI